MLVSGAMYLERTNEINLATHIVVLTAAISIDPLGCQLFKLLASMLCETRRQINSRLMPRPSVKQKRVKQGYSSMIDCALLH